MVLDLADLSAGREQLVEMTAPTRGVLALAVTAGSRPIQNAFDPASNYLAHHAFRRQSGAASTSLATTATADGQRRETRRSLQGEGAGDGAAFGGSCLQA